MCYRLLLLLSVLTCFASCKTDPAPATGPYSPPPVSDVAFKYQGEEVRIGLPIKPDNLNPLLTTSRVGRYVNDLIFQRLNGQDPETLEPIPALASLPDTRRESNGSVSYAYVLNKDATWPNGLPVTAADVVFSLKLALNPLVGGGAYRPYLESVSNVVTSPADERRFRVVTDKPYLLAQESIGDLVIYPEYVYDPAYVLRGLRMSDLANEAKAERLVENEVKAFSEAFNELASSREPADLVGSGPYEFVTWENDQEIVLQRRDDYWAEGTRNPHLRAGAPGVTFKMIGDETAMANALRDELIDVVVNLGVDQFKNLREEPYLLDRYDFTTVPSNKYFGMLFNQQHPLFRDVATRRALTKLVDVDALIEQLFPGGLATRVVGPVLPAKSYYNDELALIDYDPQAATAELAAAGWADTNGDGTVDKEIDGERKELAFDFLIFPSPTSEAVGTLVAEWAAEAGVTINVVTKEPRALYGDLNKGNFAASILGQGFSPAADDFTQSWASDAVPPNGTNRGGFADAEADRLMDKIRVTLEAEEREPLYRRLQEIIYENQPMVFLFSPQERLVVSRRLRYTPSAVAPNVLLNTLTAR